MVQALGWLKRQDHDVSGVFSHPDEFLSIGSVTAKYKLDVSPRGESAACFNQQIQALFLPHVSGVKSHSRLWRNAKLLTERTRNRHRVNFRRIHPVWKEDKAFGIYSLCRESLDHPDRDG